MNVKQVFDATAGTYDRARRQLVPCFDDFYRTVLELVPFAADAPIVVLDLGAGTGLLSAFVSAAFRNAQLTLVDVSEEMLARAHERFADRLSNVHFQAMDLASAPLPGQFDLVV